MLRRHPLWISALCFLALSSFGCRRIAKRILRGNDAAAASSETASGAAAWREPTAKPLSTLPAASSAPRKHPRLLLPALLPAAIARADAKEKRDEWPALRDWCDARLDGRTEPPEGNDYPGTPHIGEGYQGDDYFHAVMNLSLCHQIALSVDPKRAPAYGKRAASVLVAMSAPPGDPHHQDPLRDSGYGIRFFGQALAIGYDWVYDVLSPDDRKRIVAALNLWVRAFDDKGFANSHPQGNYFAGYYAAKAYAALATEGENPEASKQWKDWLDRLHAQMVQPYYAKYLAGGGWPEGWNYGPLATLNMSLPILAVETAKGLDLLRAPTASYAFPLDQAKQLLHYTWPSRKTLDDRGDQTPGDNPSRAMPHVYTVIAGLLEHWKDPLAPAFHRYAREVREATGEAVQPWQAMLFWDARASEADYATQPLSYVSQGMQTIAMRSSWKTDAVWADFTSGPYVNNGDSGEMFFDEGALTVVRGGKALLVNTGATLYRHRPGTGDGENMFDLIYADLFGSNSSDNKLRNRTLFNIYYVSASRFGQISPTPESVRTKLDRVEDRGAVVLARGVNLEDMYWPEKSAPKSQTLVASWTRQIVYVRPGLFVLDDRTERGPAGKDQWLAFHLPQADASSLRSLLPRGAKSTVVDVFNKHKVYRTEIRPADNNATQRWLTLFDAQGTLKSAVVLEAPNTVGARITNVQANGDENANVIVASVAADSTVYPVPVTRTLHVLYDLKPNTNYRILVIDNVVSIRLGAGATTSAQGSLVFTTAAGAVVNR